MTDKQTKKSLGNHCHFKHSHKPKEVKTNLNSVFMDIAKTSVAHMGIAKFVFYVAGAVWFIKNLL